MVTLRDYVRGVIMKICNPPTFCYPGEDEMEALALNAYSVLQGKCEAKEYK